VIRLLRPVGVGLVGAAGVAVARQNLEQGPVIIGIAVVLALACVYARERGGAVAALGVGAAGAFAAPDGLGPLLVVAGVVIACDVAAVDRRLTGWHDVIDAAIALPALAGLAGTVAAQPSQRGVVLGAAAGVAVLGSAWRGVSRQPAPHGLMLEPGVGLLAAFVIALAPERVAAFGDIPSATVQAARSVAAGLAVFALVALFEAVLAQRTPVRTQPARPQAAAHRRVVRNLR
jgi:hypothetical protein